MRRAAPVRAVVPGSAVRVWFRPLILLGIGAALAVPVRAADAPLREPRQRAVTMTRLVKVFFDLEWDLIEARRDRNGAATTALVSESFEQRLAASPGTPVPRDAWLDEKPVSGPWLITEMAVHEHGELFIVSFRLAGPPAAGSQFVVDVWRRKGETGHELLTRYLSPSVPPAPAQVPVVRPVTPPDGKR